MEFGKERIKPAELAIEVDLKVGFTFDSEPHFITEPLYRGGAFIRQKNFGVYLMDSRTGIISSAFIKNMPVKDYDGKSEIPPIIRKITQKEDPNVKDKENEDKEDEDNAKKIIYLEQRLEVGDAICLKPDRMFQRKRGFYAWFPSYSMFVEMYGKDGRKFFLNEPMAVLINNFHKEHIYAEAMPYERISQEQYEENKFKIIHAKKD